MAISKFRNLFEAASFRAFIPRLAHGRAIPVVHSDFVLVTAQGRAAIISRPEDDWLAIVDLSLITHLEVAPFEAATA